MLTWRNARRFLMNSNCSCAYPSSYIVPTTLVLPSAVTYVWIIAPPCIPTGVGGSRKSSYAPPDSIHSVYCRSRAGVSNSIESLRQLYGQRRNHAPTDLLVALLFGSMSTAVITQERDGSGPGTRPALPTFQLRLMRRRGYESEK